jgi:CheY-like chemotaxis protein
VVVLDIMLPGLDGLSVCRKLREQSRNDTPLRMLTARDTFDDKITGIDAGADDYRQAVRGPRALGRGFRPPAERASPRTLLDSNNQSRCGVDRTLRIRARSVADPGVPDRRLRLGRT